LYINGTARFGGSGCDDAGCGAVFKLAPNSKGGWNESVQHYFFDHPGASPAGGLIFDSAGNLYGTTARRPNHNLRFGVWDHAVACLSGGTGFECRVAA